MQIPTFESARLTFRGHRASDLDDCAQMWNTPEVTRYIGGRPFSREETWTKILRYVGHWKLMGFGYWILHDRASGRFVGEIGFADFKREIIPSIEGARELGWALEPWAHGRGLATEAVQAALAHAPPGRVVCLISPENRPSIRVAEKCGFHERARTTYHGAPTILFDRP